MYRYTDIGVIYERLTIDWVVVGVLLGVEDDRYWNSLPGRWR